MIDIKDYYEKNKGYYGEATLADVAKDVYTRGGVKQPYDQWLSSTGIQGQIEANQPAPEPIAQSSALRRYVADPLVSLVGKGAMGVYDTAVGLADYPTMGLAGKGINAAQEAVGFTPGTVDKAIESLYTPEQQLANQKFAEADGIKETFNTMMEYPSVIPHAILENIPSMVGGGFLGRKLVGKVAPAFAEAAPKTAGVIAGALGEGVVTAGQQAESIRQEMPNRENTPESLAIAAGSGVATGALSLLGGSVAKYFGLPDLDTFLASGVRGEVKKGIVRKIGALTGSVLSEGVLEELPQSIQEQVAQNIALDKPWDEGVGKAAVAGAIIGGAMGGGASLIPGTPADNADSPPPPPDKAAQINKLARNNLTDEQLDILRNEPDELKRWGIKPIDIDIVKEARDKLQKANAEIAAMPSAAMQQGAASAKAEEPIENFINEKLAAQPTRVIDPAEPITADVVQADPAALKETNDHKNFIAKYGKAAYSHAFARIDEGREVDMQTFLDRVGENWEQTKSVTPAPSLTPEKLAQREALAFTVDEKSHRGLLRHVADTLGIDTVKGVNDSTGKPYYHDKRTLLAKIKEQIAIDKLWLADPEAFAATAVPAAPTVTPTAPAAPSLSTAERLQLAKDNGIDTTGMSGPKVTRELISRGLLPSRTSVVEPAEVEAMTGAGKASPDTLKITSGVLKTLKELDLTKLQEIAAANGIADTNSKGILTALEAKGSIDKGTRGILLRGMGKERLQKLAAEQGIASEGLKKAQLVEALEKVTPTATTLAPVAEAPKAKAEIDLEWLDKPELQKLAAELGIDAKGKANAEIIREVKKTGRKSVNFAWTEGTAPLAPLKLKKATAAVPTAAVPTPKPKKAKAAKPVAPAKETKPTVSLSRNAQKLIGTFTTGVDRQSLKELHTRVGIADKAKFEDALTEALEAGRITTKRGKYVLVEDKVADKKTLVRAANLSISDPDEKAIRELAAALDEPMELNGKPRSLAQIASSLRRKANAELAPKELASKERVLQQVRKLDNVTPAQANAIELIVGGREVVTSTEEKGGVQTDKATGIGRKTLAAAAKKGLVYQDKKGKWFVSPELENGTYVPPVRTRAKSKEDIENEQSTRARVYRGASNAGDRPGLQYAGSGGTAFGWGWYTTEAEQEARDYVDHRLYKTETTYDAEGEHEERVPRDPARTIETHGYIFEYEIPDDLQDKLLDWDASLNSQTKFVHDALAKIPNLRDRIARDNRNGKDYTGGDLYRMLWREFDEELNASDYEAGRRYTAMPTNSAKATSEYLASLGIVGNKHKDALKYLESEPVTSYNLWDEEAVKRVQLLNSTKARMSLHSEEQGKVKTVEQITAELQELLNVKKLPKWLHIVPDFTGLPQWVQEYYDGVPVEAVTHKGEIFLVADHIYNTPETVRQFMTHEGAHFLIQRDAIWKKHWKELLAMIMEPGALSDADKALLDEADRHVEKVRAADKKANKLRKYDVYQEEILTYYLDSVAGKPDPKGYNLWDRFWGYMKGLVFRYFGVSPKRLGLTSRDMVAMVRRGLLQYKNAPEVYEQEGTKFSIIPFDPSKLSLEIGEHFRSYDGKSYADFEVMPDGSVVIHDVWTEPGKRRQGVASRLVNDILEQHPDVTIWTAAASVGMDEIANQHGFEMYRKKNRKRPLSPASVDYSNTNIWVRKGKDYDDDAEVYFSRIVARSRLEDEFIVGKGPKVADAAEWTKAVNSWIKKSMPETVKEELFWSGLPEWLEQQEGKVTREEVLKFLAQNGLLGQVDVKVRSTTAQSASLMTDRIREHYWDYGSGDERGNLAHALETGDISVDDAGTRYAAITALELAKFDGGIDDLYASIEQDHETLPDFIRKTLAGKVDAQSIDILTQIQDAVIDVAHDSVFGADEGPGSGQRILNAEGVFDLAIEEIDTYELADEVKDRAIEALTARREEFTKVLEAAWKAEVLGTSVYMYAELAKEDMAETARQHDLRVPWSHMQIVPERKAKEYFVVEVSIPEHGKDLPTYKSGHYEETPNQIVAARCTVLETGELFINEIQPDIHQEGKRKGYLKDGEITQEATTQFKEDLTQATAYFVQFAETRLEAEYMYDYVQSYFAKVGRDLTRRLGQEVMDTFEKEHAELAARLHTHGAKLSKVPDLPFKTNSLTLALKEVIKEAVKRGIHTIVWPKSPWQVQQIEKWPDLNYANGHWSNGAQSVAGSVNQTTRNIGVAVKKNILKYGGKLGTVSLDDIKLPELGMQAEGVDYDELEVVSVKDGFMVAMSEGPVPTHVWEDDPEWLTEAAQAEGITVYDNSRYTPEYRAFVNSYRSSEFAVYLPHIFETRKEAEAVLLELQAFGGQPLFTQEYNALAIDDALSDVVLKQELPMASIARDTRARDMLTELLGQPTARTDHTDHIQASDSIAEHATDPELRDIGSVVSRILRRIPPGIDQYKRDKDTQTTNIFTRLFSLPEYYMRRDNTAEKVLEHAMRQSDIKFQVEKNTLQDFVPVVEKIQETDKVSYDKANDYLLKTDKTGIGYSIRYKDKQWHVLSPASRVIFSFKTEQEAVEKMVAEEQVSLKALGYSENAREMIKQTRELTNRGFDLIAADMKRQQKLAKENGLPEPITSHINKDGKSEKIALSEAIALMGDLRGTYFPRERPKKNYVLTAQKPGPQGKRVLIPINLYLPGNTEQAKVRGALKELINSSLPVKREIDKLLAMGFTESEIAIHPAKQVSDVIFDVPGLLTATDSLIAAATENVEHDGMTDTEVKLLEGISQQLNQSIGDIYKAKGSFSSRVKRAAVHWEGYEEDALKALTSYTQRLAAGTARRETARGMLTAFTGRDISWAKYQESHPNAKYKDYRADVRRRAINASTQKNLYDDTRMYMTHVLRPDNATDRFVGYLKGLSVLMFLGFRVSSAAVNMTNMAMAVPATIAAHTGMSITKAWSEITSAAAKYAKYRAITLEGEGVISSAFKKHLGKLDLDPKDKDIFDHITRAGWDEAQFNQDSVRVLQDTASEAWNKSMGAAMFMFGAAEKANRAMTLFAATKAHMKADPTLNVVDALTKAKHTSDRAHGTYGKAAKPWLVQKVRFLDMPYTFFKFQQNYMLNMLELGMKYGAWKNAVPYTLTAPAILSGASASLVMPIVAAALKAAGYDDPEEEFYGWAEKTFGSDDFARHGIAGLAGVNLKGSLEITSPFPDLSKGWFGAMGAPGGVFLNIGAAYEHFKKGETAKGIEKLLPSAAASMAKGYREMTEGVTDSAYAPIFQGGEKVKGTELDFAARLLSFNPARISEIRERTWREDQVRMEYQKARSDITAGFNRLLAKVDKATTADFAELYAEVYAYNDRVTAADPKYQIPYITAKWLKTSLKRSQTPDKYEKAK